MRHVEEVSVHLDYGLIAPGTRGWMIVGDRTRREVTEAISHFLVFEFIVAGRGTYSTLTLPRREITRVLERQFRDGG